MRTLIVLCFAAVAFAQYDYQPVGQGSSASFDGAAPAGAVDGGADSGFDGVAADPSSAVQGDYSGASNASPAIVPQSEVEKEFYTFSADDNDFNDGGALQGANSAKQSLRVVFIKSPENRGLEDAALSLAKQAGEQKTAIYVLKKQTDIGDLANKLNNLNQNGNNKPEVHFVKYRTPEDAANAQRAIQGQYDSLGGNTKSVNGGIAPVLDFASRAPVASAYNSGANIAGPSNSYIPPASVPAAVPSKSYIPAAPVSAPVNTYIPPAAATEAPANTYIPPTQAPVAVDDPSTSYLPASILRLFRL